MSVFKCKMCGGDLLLTEGSTVAECEYCGSKQTLPKLDSDRKANLYDRANHFRRNNEFDKAAGIYEQILNEDTTDAEAYWSLVLCRYGIEYVEDPATRKRVPTVNRAQFTSIFDDDNYKSALQYADGYQRTIYESEANVINEIQKGILAISQKEEPFDVFICYKETDASGRRTQDSVLANDLYHQLTNEGFKVFFSRITLEDKLGTAYEPYIFAALNSAKVMVVLGTKPEHFNAVWVKNEWSRYLSLVKQSGGKKVLIPAYRDMDPYDLPDEFSHLQAQDMSKLGFMQDLIRGIKKITSKNDGKANAVPYVQQVVESSGGTNITSQIKRGMQALEDHDWAQATVFFDKALDLDAECAEAFYGKALADEQCVNDEEFVNKRLSIPVNNSETITACQRDDDLITENVSANIVPGYFDTEAATRCFSFDSRTYPSLTAGWKKRIVDEKDHWEKDRLLSRTIRYAKGNFAGRITTIRAGIISALEDSLKKSIEIDDERKIDVSSRYAEEMKKAAAEVVFRREQAEQKRIQDYEKACKAQADAKTEEEFNSALRLFEATGLRDFQDCAERAEQCRQNSKSCHKKEKSANTRKTILIVATLAVITAFIILLSAVIIPSAKYNKACALLESNDYLGAMDLLESLHYKDSHGRYCEAFNKLKGNLILEGDAYLENGNYAQAAVSYLHAGRKDLADKAFNIGSKLYVNVYSSGGIMYDGTIRYQTNSDYDDNTASGLRGMASFFSNISGPVGTDSEGRLLYSEECSWEYKNLYKQIQSRGYQGIISLITGVSKRNDDLYYYCVILLDNGKVIEIAEDGMLAYPDIKNWSNIVYIQEGHDCIIAIDDANRIQIARETGGESNSYYVSSFPEVKKVLEKYYKGFLIALTTDGKLLSAGKSTYLTEAIKEKTNVADFCECDDGLVLLYNDGTVELVIEQYDNEKSYNNQMNSYYKQVASELSSWKRMVSVQNCCYGIIGMRYDGSIEYVSADIRVKDSTCSYNTRRDCDDEVSSWEDVVYIVSYDSPEAPHVIGVLSDGSTVYYGNGKYHRSGSNNGKYYENWYYNGTYHIVSGWKLW